MRLSPGPQGASRARVLALNAALVAAAALAYVLARPRHRVVISDLERQPVDAPPREQLDVPPELDGDMAAGDADRA